MSGATLRRLGTWVGCLLVLSTVFIPALARGKSRGTRFEGTGVIRVLVEDDFATGRIRHLYYLETRPGVRPIRLELEQDTGQALRSGARVRVRGTSHEGTLRVRAEDGGALEVLAPAVAVSGSRASVVLVVDFQDSTVACDEASIDDLMYSGNRSVDGLYQESSFGAVSFPGDVDGDGQPDVHRVSIDADTTGACDYGAWSSAANTAAEDAAIDLGPYQHRVYVLPSNVPCGWAGLAHLGCFGSCNVWVKTCNLQDVYAHELGHNLGMGHASTDTDNDGVKDCEYCDHSDTMGIGGVGWRQFNGPHKEQMAWLPAGQILEIDPAGTQNYVLSPLEVDPATAPYPQVLKIARPGNGDFYYLSYRRPIGYDQTLNGSYADRTSVHTYPGNGSASTLFVAALQDGEEVEDTGLGVTVSQISHDDLSVTLQVSGTGCEDPDGDGVCSPEDNCPGVENADQADLDGDDLGDVCDDDDDGDGLTDADEATLGTDPTDPDTNGDTVQDGADNCPLADNTDQADADGDGVGDVCDDPGAFRRYTPRPRRGRTSPSLRMPGAGG